MKRLTRRLLTAVTALSLLASATATITWAATSFGPGSVAVLQGPNASYVVTFLRGSLAIQVATIYLDPERPATSRWQRFGGSASDYRFNPLADTSGWGRTGLISTIQRIPYSDGRPYDGPPGGSMTGSINATCRSVVVPLWAVALAAGVVPAGRFGRAIRQSRRDRVRRSRLLRGQCPQCAYDLAGNVSGICPECGTATPSAPEGRQTVARSAS